MSECLRMRHPAFASVGVFTLLLILSACAGLSGKQSDMSYAAASDRITLLAERSISIGIDNESDLVERNLHQGLCDNAFGSLSDYVRPVIRYEFPLDQLDYDPDGFSTDVEGLWVANDLETSSDVFPTIETLLGSSEDGFNFQLTINRESGRIYVDASGPCVEPPDG